MNNTCTIPYFLGTSAAFANPRPNPPDVTGLTSHFTLLSSLLTPPLLACLFIRPIQSHSAQLECDAKSNDPAHKVSSAPYPFASPSLSPRGTGSTGKPGARRDRAPPAELLLLQLHLISSVSRSFEAPPCCDSLIPSKAAIDWTHVNDSRAYVD